MEKHDIKIIKLSREASLLEFHKSQYYKKVNRPPRVSRPGAILMIIIGVLEFICSFIDIVNGKTIQGWSGLGLAVLLIFIGVRILRKWF